MFVKKCRMVGVFWNYKYYILTVDHIRSNRALEVFLIVARQNAIDNG